MGWRSPAHAILYLSEKESYWIPLIVYLFNEMGLVYLWMKESIEYVLPDLIVHVNYENVLQLIQDHEYIRIYRLSDFLEVGGLLGPL